MPLFGAFEKILQTLTFWTFPKYIDSVFNTDFFTVQTYFYKTLYKNRSQSNQIVVINLTIVIHIQVIVPFFSFFIVKSYSSHFQKKKAIF